MKSNITRLSSQVILNLLLICTSAVFATDQEGELDNPKLAKYRERAGQLIMVGFEGQYPEDPGVKDIVQQIEHGSVGGVVLYARNIKDTVQLSELTKHLHAAAPAKKPLLISVDQEGGAVQRLSKAKGFLAITPSAYDICHTTSSIEDVCAIYGKLAEMLRQNAINLNLGPVVDLHQPESKAIGKWKRAYSEDPAVVSKCAEKFIDAHHEHGVLTSLKHFPGHGLAVSDSHEGSVNGTMTAKPELELIPFYDLIRANKVDTIMTAHIQNMNIDSQGMPATLSKIIIPQLLRQDGHFDGVVISDDLGMKAICAKYSMDLATRYAFQDATCDILLYANNDSLLESSDHHAITKNFLGENRSSYLAQQVLEGNIQKDRLKESYGRVLKLKEKL